MARGDLERTQDDGWVKVKPGIEMRSLVEGAGTALVLYRIEPGRNFIPHTHPFPEYGTVILGRGRLLLDGRPQELLEGNSYFVPKDIPHGFDSPPQPGPIVLLHVVVERELTGPPLTFRRMMARTREVVAPLPA